MGNPNLTIPNHQQDPSNPITSTTTTTHHYVFQRQPLSHTAAKAGPFTISSFGAPAKDNSQRTQGQWDQTVGSAKETVGNLVGSADLKQQGREQNLQGQSQEAKGQLSDLGKGVSDRVQGAVGGAAAALTGDRAEQQRYADVHDEGKTGQRGVELDLDKQAAAQK